MFLVILIDWLDCVCDEIHCDTLEEAKVEANYNLSYRTDIRCVQIYKEIETYYAED